MDFARHPGAEVVVRDDSGHQIHHGVGAARLLRLLALAARERAMKCLSRTSGRGDGWIEGELLDPTTYAAALEGADAVVHLAALTGKGTDAEHHRANVECTEALLGAAIEAKVRRFVFVSTIAVRYPEKKAYRLLLMILYLYFFSVFSQSCFLLFLSSSLLLC